MIRVFVIAPTPMMQAGLRTMLTTAGMQVVGEAALPDRLVRGISDIDVIVVAEEKLLEDVEGTLVDNSSIALVVLSNNDERLISELNAKSLRGWAILPLDAPTTQLQAAVLAVAEGFVTLPTISAERWLTNLQQTEAQAEEIDAGLVDEPLTSREREVLELLSRGLPNKLIARRLQISEHTVKFHVSSIYTKLGASSRTDAVSRGVRRGLITL